jgi:acyl-[acyl-carrier-protein]-phospholipid O-acyltransferase/long-chain-fatty-acid--[acyl-carrier-protein] ligase
VIAKVALGGGSGLVTLVLSMFSVGIGVGSVLCARLLRGQVSLRFVPWAALGISLFTADFAWACRGGPGLGTVAAMLGDPRGWHLLLDLLLLAACGGLYSVPLYATVQHLSAASERARMIAGNNVMNAAFMVAGAALAAGLAGAGMAASNILLLVAAANLLVGLLSFRLRHPPEVVPQTMESPSVPR